MSKLLMLKMTQSLRKFGTSIEIWWRKSLFINPKIQVKSINLLLIFFFMSCTNTPRVYREAGKFPIRSAIRHTINRSGLTTNLGIKIVSLKTHQTLYELNAHSLFNPASNNKLFTCIASLALIDTGYTFSTSVYQGKNNIFLVAGGDPDLTLEELDSLAKMTSANLTEIDTLFLDRSLFDTTRFGEGWMWDEGPWKYAAQISALSVNDNTVDFYVTPGTLNQPVQITTNPITNYIQILNQTNTVNDTIGFEPLTIDRDWENKTNLFTITGMVMDTASVDTLTRNIENPTLFTGHLFASMLKNHGLHPKVIIERKYMGHGHLVALYQSQSLIHSLKNLMKESDNLTAEVLVKMIGHQITDSMGTWQNGLTAIKTFLNKDVGLDTSSFNLADGSGVSRYNYYSPNHFVKLLTWAYENRKIRDNLLSVLPVGGWDGTLKDRMNGQYANHILAKTGTLSGVSCLSGYVFTRSGEPLAFSIMMNGYVQSSGPYRNLQDNITKILSELK